MRMEKYYCYYCYYIVGIVCCVSVVVVVVYFYIIFLFGFVFVFLFLSFFSCCWGFFLGGRFDCCLHDYYYYHHHHHHHHHLFFFFFFFLFVRVFMFETWEWGYIANCAIQLIGVFTLALTGGGVYRKLCCWCVHTCTTGGVYREL